MFSRIHGATRRYITFIVVIRLHRSTTYVDTAYCYRPSSVVCLSVGLSVRWSVQHRRTAKPIEIPFRLWTRVGPRNHVLDGGAYPPWKGGNFDGEEDGPLSSIGLPTVCSGDAVFCQITLTIC